MSQSQSTAVATVAPSQQVAVQPSRAIQNAARIFSKSAHAGSEQPVAESQAIVAKWEADQMAETKAKMQPQDIANATRLYNHFRSPQLESWAAANGLRGNVWVADFLGRVWNHIASVEQERDALRKEVATFKTGRR